jgi:hypothetical protein
LEHKRHLKKEEHLVQVPSSTVGPEEMKRIEQALECCVSFSTIQQLVKDQTDVDLTDNQLRGLRRNLELSSDPNVQT